MHFPDFSTIIRVFLASTDIKIDYNVCTALHLFMLFYDAATASFLMSFLCHSDSLALTPPLRPFLYRLMCRAVVASLETNSSVLFYALFL